jgi:asparagine synthase (glutamine-hydrolysing)
MCGITGVYNINDAYPIDHESLVGMTDTLHHRGPDFAAHLVWKNFGVGFKRLSIIDLENGQQPFYSEDHSIVMICNGEIYNFRELRQELIAKGYTFKTQCDVEVIIPLYQEYGVEMLNKLNGQFAFVIFDQTRNELLLARDQFGICPLFYAIINKVLIFGSEIKAVLKHPLVKPQINLTGLDQIFSFPANVSPTTMFKGINSLKPGHFIQVRNGVVRVQEYWDLDFPDISHDYGDKPEKYYIDRVEELLFQSVKYRLNADVPVGFYLSGGLDSSLLGAMMAQLNTDVRHNSFSIRFPNQENKDIDERKYQQMMARHLNLSHHEITFDEQNIEAKLKDVVYYAECPLKETYNTCSLTLSEALRKKNIKVTLCGEGADELFGGYFGYKFDYQRSLRQPEKDMSDYLEEQIRHKLWGNADLAYENNQFELLETKKALYSTRVNGQYGEFDCLDRLEINKDRLQNRHIFNQRSYLDFKLRLAGHLIADHGDRMTYANSVEGRYPFLDINLIEAVKLMPPHLKLNGMVEKYTLKQVARKYVPQEIVDRQKFGFVAPGSPQLLRNNHDWVNDMLSYDTIKRQGYFNPDVVERLKKTYTSPGFKINAPYESDVLIVVLTFGILLELFNVPSL